MGLFKPAHSEYSDACFEDYLFYLCELCGMRDGEELSQARSALQQHWADHTEFFSRSNFGKQVTVVKKQLYRARNQIAREAGFREWSSRELAEFALAVHKVNDFGNAGGSYADLVVRRKVELLEQVAILEVCDELGIDLFDDSEDEAEG